MRTNDRGLSMDNKGMSLVEIVIVVTIMTVLTGVLALGVSMALSKPADECAEKIVSTLNGARVTTMGKQGITMRFYQNDNGVYLEETITDASGSVTTRPALRIGQKGVKVEYKLINGTTEGAITTLDTTGITLSFKRDTGGFNAVSGDWYCKEIVVSKGNRTKTIRLAHLTGKVTIE